MQPVDYKTIEALQLVSDKPCRIAVYAKDQPQYVPLPALVYPDGRILTEWTLTEDERARILAGENIRLTIWTFNRSLQPVYLEVSGGA